MIGVECKVFSPPLGSEIPICDGVEFEPFDYVSYDSNGYFKVAEGGDWVIGIAQISHIKLIVPFKL